MHDNIQKIFSFKIAIFLKKVMRRRVLICILQLSVVSDNRRRAEKLAWFSASTKSSSLIFEMG